MRLTRTRTAVLVAVTALGALATLPAVSSAAESADPVSYARVEPLCSAPTDPRMMRCYGLKRVPVPAGTRGATAYRPHASRGPAGGYTPKALTTAYGVDPTIKRSSLTVAIVLWHDAPNVLADLNVFNRHYGFPKETSRSFRKVNERGASSPLPRRDSGAAGEIALDTQAVRAMCRTCRILLVEADDAYDDDLAAAQNTAVRLGADVITNSYGTPERSFSAKVKAAYRHPGVAVLASTGDSGWFGWDYANNPTDIGDGAASFPASSPFVIAVGGTTLTLNAANKRTRETVWNNNGPHDSVGNSRNQPQGASGGGCSKLFTAQPWQSHVAGYSRTDCGGRRLAADVSLVADPSTGFDVYDSYGSGGWVTIGGTSLSSPLAAGMVALAGGARGARYPSSAIYANAAAYPGRRTDVTVGGNGFCHTDSAQACSDAVYNSRLIGRTRNPNKLGMGAVDCSFGSTSEKVPAHRSTECTATTGFDGPSGVGTPNSIKLFVRSDPTVTIGHSPATHGRSALFRATVRAPLPNTSVKRVTWTWGDGRRSVTTGKEVRHTYAKKGRYTLSVTVQDSRHQTVNVRRTVAVG